MQITNHKDSSDVDLHEQLVRTVAGTLAIEGIELSENSKRNLERYANGEADAQQLLEMGSTAIPPDLDGGLRLTNGIKNDIL